MVKPICVPCQRFFRPTKNGKPFIEGMPDGNDVPPGLAAPDQWRPYKLWMGDEWGCPDCGATIIVGVGHTRIAEHYEPDFQAQVESFGATLQINDC
jgi:hypothetical protein